MQLETTNVSTASRSIAGGGYLSAPVTAIGSITLIQYISPWFSLQAQTMYKEALQHTPDHCPSLLALSRLALAAGDLDACQAHCSALLQVQPDNEDAAIMLAELMFYQVGACCCRPYV